MTSVDLTEDLPPERTTPFRRARALLKRSRLADTPLNAALTLATAVLLVWTVPPVVRWAVLDATLFGTPETCAARGGACWAFVIAKIRFILFGFYPPKLQGRAGLALVLLVGLVVLSALPRLWRRLPLLWGAGIAAGLALLAGSGSASPVVSDKWGGFTLTVLMTLIAFAGAFPVAVLLALGRRSTMGGIRLFATIVVEVMRGVPFIAVLYVVTLLVPLALPADLTLDKLSRALLGMTLFIAAYMAEIVRAGLQSVPGGQEEAARALGLGYWGALRVVILPQALRAVIPSFVNLATGLFQETTLVVVIGMFDFLNAARVAATDPAWLGFYDEAFAFAAAVYFVVCLGASRYSLWLEVRLRPPGR